MAECNCEKDGKYIGYHSKRNLPIQAGDIVTIPKGTKYHSTKDGEYHIAGKTYKVKVDHMLSGCEYDGKITNPEVSWAGSGGYWYRADINEVRK